MVSRNHTLPSARGLVEEGLEPVRRLVERSGINVILFHPLVSWMKKLRWGGCPWNPVFKLRPRMWPVLYTAVLTWFHL